MTIAYFKLDLTDPASKDVLTQLEAEFHKVYPDNIFSVNVSDDGTTGWAKGVTFATDDKGCVTDTATMQTHDKVVADCSSEQWKADDSGRVEPPA
jgi:hypothetical protein